MKWCVQQKNSIKIFEIAYSPFMKYNNYNRQRDERLCVGIYFELWKANVENVENGQWWTHREWEREKELRERWLIVPRVARGCQPQDNNFIIGGITWARCSGTVPTYIAWEGALFNIVLTAFTSSFIDISRECLYILLDERERERERKNFSLFLEREKER